jgi:hypothetical protein
VKNRILPALSGCLALGALCGAGLASSGSAVPPGSPVPARLAGLYVARFTTQDEQTTGTWNLRLGPGHHLEIWNRGDPVAHSPTFEGGPVSFRGNRMIFAQVTAEGVCRVGATYEWTLTGRLLRFRLVGKDGCEPRVITFTPHAWRRV